MCCKMVWKFCEIWKILWEMAFRWAKFCEILSHSVRYGMYVVIYEYPGRMEATICLSNISIKIQEKIF